MQSKHIIKINLPGGIIAAGDLYALMDAAGKAGVEQVQPGNRQQLFCSVAVESLDKFTGELDQLQLFYEVDADESPNIVSSYVAQEVFQNAYWLSESLYKDILSQFDYRPALKISLVDAQQTFIPFLTGHINFISSPVNNYWYVYIRFPRTSVTYCWTELIYSGDISRISRLIEITLSGKKDLFHNIAGINGELLQQLVHAVDHFITQPVQEPLQAPEFSLPYYEGFNRYGDKSWLGIYRRNELFPVPFLKEIAMLCLNAKIGQLYTTPWKSIIIKGILPGQYAAWDYVLGKYRINVHHAANELNWQLEDLNEEGLQLKRYLNRQFDKEDIRTHGLCFAIKINPHAGLYGSVVIRKQENTARNQLKALNRYDILYTRDLIPMRGNTFFSGKMLKSNTWLLILFHCVNIFMSLKVKQTWLCTAFTAMRLNRKRK